MKSSKKQIQPYILRVVIKKEKILFIYYYTVSLLLLFQVCEGTPLSEAARNGYTDFLTLLIEKGVHVNRGWVR